MGSFQLIYYVQATWLSSPAIVRYADDFIVGFQHEVDARRFLDAMRERLQEFALSLHPEKTRLIEFGRLAAENRKRRGLGKPETFTFLGLMDELYLSKKCRYARSKKNGRSVSRCERRRIAHPFPEGASQRLALRFFARSGVV